MSYGGLKVFSEPVTLRWDGWEARTDLLQRHGWQLNADQDVRSHRIQIAARHPNGLSLLTECEDWHYYHARDFMRGFYPTLPPLRVRHMGKIEMIWYGSSPGASAFTPVDAMPRATQVVSTGRIEDFFHFAPVTSPHDLIVPQASVPELLDRILQLQQPACEDRAKARVAARLLTL